MITRVDTVLIGKKCPTAYTNVDALVAGDVALFNENRALITTAAAAATANSLYIGIAQEAIQVNMPDGNVATKANIQFSNEIKKGSKPSAVVGATVAPVQEVITINLTDAIIIAGNRYVLRMVYRDIYEAPGQFTHTYELYANSANVADFAAELTKKINKHTNRRVYATVTDAVITLTALVKDDNEGVYSISEYSVVNMEASLYTTVPGALLSNNPQAIVGAEITKTEGNPGKGYWKQVRDVEVRMMGYKGHVFSGAYPIIEQSRKVEEGVQYDYATIENDNLYLSNDNQYIKTTPMVTELYVKAGTLVSSIVAEGIKSFIAA